MDGKLLFNSPFEINGRIGHVDATGNIYILQDKPYPKITKYKIFLD